MGAQTGIGGEGASVGDADVADKSTIVSGFPSGNPGLKSKSARAVWTIERNPLTFHFCLSGNESFEGHHSCQNTHKIGT